MPSNDLNLYVQWMPKEQTITFSPGYYGDSSKIPDAIKSYTGEVVDLSSVPKPVIADNYKDSEYIYFPGIWCYKNSDNDIILLDLDMIITMPSESIELYPYTKEVNPYKDIKIQASNVTFTVEEYKKYLSNGNLKSEILIRSCPNKLDNNNTLQAISILLLDVKMDNLPSDGLSGKYTVIIKYLDGIIGSQPVDIIVEIINDPISADQSITLQETTNSVP